MNMIKITLIAGFLLMPFQTLAISSYTCLPIKIKSKELNQIFRVSKFPKSSLKNRNWKAKTCYIDNPKENTKYIEIESTSYEKGKNYERYFVNTCDNFPKTWHCYNTRDVFRLRNSPTIPYELESKITTPEILNISELIRESTSPWKNQIINDYVLQFSITKLPEKFSVWVKYSNSNCGNYFSVSLKEIGVKFVPPTDKCMVD